MWEYHFFLNEFLAFLVIAKILKTWILKVQKERKKRPEMQQKIPWDCKYKEPFVYDFKISLMIFLSNLVVLGDLTHDFLILEGHKEKFSSTQKASTHS